MASITSIAKMIGLSVILGGTFLTSYQCLRNQSVTYERDNYGNVTSVRLHQFGRNAKLIADPNNSDRLIVEGSPTLDYICESIESGAKNIYNSCQSRGKQSSNISDSQIQQIDYSPNRVNQNNTRTF